MKLNDDYARFFPIKNFIVLVVLLISPAWAGEQNTMKQSDEIVASAFLNDPAVKEAREKLAKNEMFAPDLRANYVQVTLLKAEYGFILREKFLATEMLSDSVGKTGIGAIVVLEFHKPVSVKLIDLNNISNGAVLDK